MCGIAAIIDYSAGDPSANRQAIKRMCDRMITRGPDGEGLYSSPDHVVHFGHRRLAIIDLSEDGNQPMFSADGQLGIVFNGEIYNYKELRAETEKQGAKYVSNSDTEVLLHLYRQKGPAMVDSLRGMFAICLYDFTTKTTFLARDPMGIKPLFYSVSGNTLRVASQVKALQAGGDISNAPNQAGIAGFYLTGSVPEPHTIYRDIHALPSGGIAKFESGGAFSLSVRNRLSDVFTNGTGADFSGLSQNELLETVRGSMLESVRSHMVADVPVGAFLSAGIDSGAIVGLMKDAGASDVQSITLGYSEYAGSSDDESTLAAEVAKHYDVSHVVRSVDRDEFLADRDSLLHHMDQPSIDGTNTWFVSKAAAEAGLKVAMSGCGGDELFGGYDTFSRIPRWRKMMSPLALHSSLRKGAGLALAVGEKTGLLGSPKARDLVKYGNTDEGAYLVSRGLFMPRDLPLLMGEDAAREGLGQLDLLGSLREMLVGMPQNDFARISLLESSMFLRNQLLRDSDWAGMAHSLEIRVPLVDYVLSNELSHGLSTMANPIGKELLAKTPAKPLPDKIINRPKTGFQIPVKQWMGEASGSITSLHPKIESILPKGAAWTRRWAISVLQSEFGKSESEAVVPNAALAS